MNEMTNYDQRLSTVERELQSVVTEVHSIARGVAELGAYQRAQGAQFEKVADGFEEMLKEKGHASPEWDTRAVISAVAGTMVTVALIVSGLLYGVGGYVDMRVDGNEATLVELKEWKQDKDAFQREMHYEMGGLKTTLADRGERMVMDEARIGKLEDEVITLREKAAAAEVSRRAMGDYIRDVDRYGSRAWVDSAPNRRP